MWVFFIRFLNAKANFTIITWICDHESFKNLLTIANKLIFVTKISFEFGQFMAQKGEVPFQSTILLNIHVFMYTYLFPCTIGTNVHVDILASKKLLTLIKSIVFVFPRDRQLYKWEVFSKVVLQVLKPIILNGMVCLSIFSGRVGTNVYLVSPIYGYWFCDFMFSKRISLNFILFF